MAAVADGVDDARASATPGSAIGSYSHLTIGKLVFEWKYHVPSISR